ncbi:acyl-CoA dehydrogenase family protein [Nocardiopsis sp. HNM0947]|uniref:Acyl-CoA dehydrogenase family protein n=1 Tax=Nocardiopsis coralli TaxID=2772213 RepID=A0ABR9PBI6_9ACTN|nr:acyl-CoA dehydrogenase family protein [Nocardiopsis coralli]MBE3001208.1 acyl-CoA dehydrogenase family protein [Nocardiopsis coralli]
MDLDLTADQQRFRAEMRAWMHEHVPPTPLPSLETEEGFALHRGWEKTLGAARLSAVSWPQEFGGLGATPLEWLIFEEEYYAAGGPARLNQSGINLLAPTLMAHGTDEQLHRVLPPMAAGEVVWAQAWSEPDSGSDLASLRSTATRTDGGWLLNGHKIWSSRAPFADRAFGLFRSSGERHRGLTYVMFDLAAPGLTVRPIGRLDGKPAFAELFLDDVFVPDRDVIGEPGDGWRVAMSTAGDERGLTLRSPGRFVASAERLVELWRERADPADTAVRDRVVDAWIGARAYQLHGFATIARPDPVGFEASMNKVFWSELDLAMTETALDLLGPDGELDGPWLEDHVFALAGPIYAGTNEIQRNVVAERVLGLPRAQKGRR